MPQVAAVSAENNPLALLPTDVWARLGKFSVNAYGLAELDPKIEEEICAPIIESLTQEQVKILYLLISLGWLERKDISFATEGYPPITIPGLRPLSVGDSRLIDKVVELISKTPELKEQLGTIAKQMNCAIDYKWYARRLIICSTLISLIIFGLYKLHSVLFSDAPVHRTAKLGNSCCLLDACAIDPCTTISCADVLSNSADANSWLNAREYPLSLSAAISQCTTLIAQCANAIGVNDGFITLLDGSAAFGDGGITGICQSNDNSSMKNSNHELYMGIAIAGGVVLGIVPLFMFVYALGSLVIDLINRSIVLNFSSLGNDEKKIPLKAAQYANLQSALFQLGKNEGATRVVEIDRNEGAEAAPLLPNRH